MTRVLFLFGTRPEAIKLCPLIRAFRESPDLKVGICSTGQHREMLDQVLDFFSIKPDYALNLMKPNQDLSTLTAEILQEVSHRVISDFKPDWLFVQGDTTSAMAGAMAGFYCKAKVAHVEAGLRSHNLTLPFPEEMNRVVISKIAACHFCPTDTAVSNLKSEGITQRVYKVGNTVVDAVQESLAILDNADQQVFHGFFKGVNFNKKIILVTCHRRESFGESFHEICLALRALADRDDCEVIYPVHLNPNITEKANEYLQHPAIKLLTPLSYPQLLWLMSKSYLVLTDSGGIQEEAPSLGKPVLVLRDVTERMEGIEAGTALLVGTRSGKIIEAAQKLLIDTRHYNSMKGSKNPYGDGKAAQRIRDILTAWV